jgi:enoyl-CoA hydratase
LKRDRNKIARGSATRGIGRKGPRPRDGVNGARSIDAAGDPGSVKVQRQGSCIITTLNRPAARNRVSASMAAALMELAEAIEDDDSVRGLLVTGAGTVFCEGFDPDVDPRTVETLAAISKPTVAIVNGNALDEGLELALGLDLRATHSGARLALTQLQRGALPRFGGTQRLPRLVGATQALTMLLTGDALGGRDALRFGLVTYLAADARGLRETRRELLEMLESRGPLGARLVKEAVRKGADMTLEQGIRLEEDLYALLQTTADRAEGVRAFLEKRKPLFRGI